LYAEDMIYTLTVYKYIFVNTEEAFTYMQWGFFLAHLKPFCFFCITVILD